ncbi:MAG: hypothetical protein AAF289_05115 [Cyanobacteria bacterium P01_A01_bin.135]
MSLPTAPSWFSTSASTQPWLAAAAQSWEDTQTSERYVEQALAQPDVDLEALVSAYRYYFYKNQDAKALEMAIAVTERIQRLEQWPAQWDDLKPILLARLDDDVCGSI